MSALIINGVTVTAPKSFQVDLSDLDSDESGRNTNGVMERDRLRAGMRKLECEWGPLTKAETSAILQAVSGVSFSVKYPDPLDGTDDTKTFYVGDRTSPAFDWDSDMWLGLKLDLTEM